jgi:hypothetical protein
MFPDMEFVSFKEDFDKFVNAQPMQLGRRLAETQAADTRHFEQVKEMMSGPGISGYGKDWTAS